VIVDYRKVLSNMPAAQRAAAKATIDKVIASLGSPTVPMDVWVDSDGRVRRMNFDMHVTVAAGTSTDMTMSMEYFDFGVPVHPHAPPASQTTDMASLGASTS
jgi:hypothetical protein